MPRLLTAFVAVLLPALLAARSAQGAGDAPSEVWETSRSTADLNGVVLDDSTGRPIKDAEVALPGLGLKTMTTERGAFRFSGVPAGIHQMTVRRVAYRPFDMELAFANEGTVSREVRLARLTTLKSVVVTTDRTLIPDFEENRSRGFGHFLTRGDLAKQEGRRLSEVLGQTGGIAIEQGTGGRAWLASSRGTLSLEHNKLLDNGDVQQGARRGKCYAQVYIDRALVYGARDNDPLFDINSISPSTIEAIEYYAGPAQTPLKYRGLNSTCGVLVIHMRRSP